jgi:MOSC domain-containing protein YiiM
MQQANIHHIFISTGHNYVGHHGKEPGSNPMKEVSGVECVAGKGIVGDRYYAFKEDFKGQITFFDFAVFEMLKTRFPGVSIQPSAVRRNVFVEGLDLNALIGKDFVLQGIRFSGSQEAAPCYWMNRAVGEGAEEFLARRGGLRARIHNDGNLTVGPATLEVLGEI